MRSITYSLLLTLLSPSAVSQCCGGKNNITAKSPDGRFMVCADTSVPFSELYQFRFYERTAAGHYRECSSFTVQFSNHSHFRICVSPTGNGFVVHSGLAEGILLYGRDGTRLRACLPPPQSYFHSSERDSTGLFLLVGACGTETPRLRRFFVPTGRFIDGPHIVDGATIWLRRMLHWDPRREVRDAESVRSAIAQLRRGFADRWVAAERVLITSGLSARPALISELAKKPSERIQHVLAEIDKLLCGHLQPHRDLDLLCVLTKHPNLELSAEARSRLQRILPKGAAPTIEWVGRHRRNLRWDETSQVYVRA